MSLRAAMMFMMLMLILFKRNVNITVKNYLMIRRLEIRHLFSILPYGMTTEQEDLTDELYIYVWSVCFVF